MLIIAKKCHTLDIAIINGNNNNLTIYLIIF